MTVSGLDPQTLASANINPISFLATDYLNHFNEVVMLMEMVPDMPDMIADVMDWQPRDYVAHFEQSVFAEKALAIAAYRNAPQRSRERFERVAEELDTRISDIQVVLAGVDTGKPLDPAVADRLTTAIVAELRPAIDRASAIINAVDDPRMNAQEDQEKVQLRAQDAIDQLFA